MQCGIVFERIEETNFPSGYYYAHIPSLGLTTHGLGIDGAREAAVDLIRLWVAEKQTYVAMHPGDIPEGTLRNILKQAGLTSAEFKNL
jgi:hypothetical protein